jgi:beta-lactamase class D
MAERRRIFGFLTAALVLLVALLFGVAFVPLRNARNDFRTHRTADAIVTANRWISLRLWSRQYRQVLAASYLASGDRPAAQPHLDALRGKRQWISVLTKLEVANRLFARGAYEDFLAYDAAVHDRGDDDVALYRAAAQVAIGDVKEAEATLGTLDRGDVDAQKLAALERALADRRTGAYPLVVDRNGQTIATYVLANHDVVAINTDFAPFIEKEAGGLTIESLTPRIGVTTRIETTLDAAMQKAALSALAGFRSSLVAIDPRTNEILVLASNRGDGPIANLAIEQQYEPGSTMKVLTSLAARENGVALPFPYTCTGSLTIDGRNFGDWMAGGHGPLASFDEALARSCNVVFADYGVRLGRDRLQAFFTKAGFEGQADLGLFHAPLGRKVGNIFNSFETAFFAIGLEHETATTLHLAMIASMMANRGAFAQPRIYTARRSILGEVIGEAPKPAATQIADRRNAEEVVRGMMAVVTHPLGTGRRAAIDGVALALKTGTAGKEEHGYHAIVIGFAPADHPKIAFALVAEASGPAEFAAAKIAHDFLTAIRGRL